MFSSWKRESSEPKARPIAQVVGRSLDRVVGGGMKRKGIAQRLCDKRTELENLRRRTNAMRRRYSVCMKQWRKLLKAYEAECRKHCTPNT